MAASLTDLIITDLGDDEKDKQYKIKTFTLPKTDPWIVEIDGNHYNVQSAVGRLLLHLAKKKAPAAKK